MGFFSQAKASFTDFESYRVIAFQRTGKTIKYLFLLFTLIFIIGGIKFSYDFNANLGDTTASIKDKTPEFSLANGELTVQGQQPMIFTGDNEVALIIDTTGKTDETELDKYSEGAFIAKDRVVTKQNLQTRTIKFADLANVSFDKQKLISYLPLFKWVLPIIGVVAYIFGITWVVITTIFLALIGLIVNSSVKAKLEFGNIWNIGVYAFTLPWLLELLVNLSGLAIPLFWFVKWGLAVFFLYKGIEAANRQIIAYEPPLPPPPQGMV
jgi:hypothetical protein